MVRREDAELARFPLHTLEGIFTFSYAGASPALMGACAKRNINLAFCKPSGRFLARATGESNGNVLLRRMQYRLADEPGSCCRLARNLVFGKVYNARWSIERTLRDHALRVDAATLEYTSAALQQSLPKIAEAESLETLRGLEGEAASGYFGVFDEMILNNKEDFFFHGRSRRPPLDR